MRNPITAVLLSAVALAATGITGKTPDVSLSSAQKIANRECAPIYGEWSSFPDIAGLDAVHKAAKLSLSWNTMPPVDKDTLSPVGLKWDRKMSEYPMLTKTFLNLEQARKNYAAVKKLNPNTMLGVEMRWDAVEEYELPPDHKWWKRNILGKRIPYGQPKPPRYEMNVDDPEYVAWFGERCKALLDSGVVDFIFLDHITYFVEHGGDPVPFLKTLREKLGPDAVIIGNTHFKELKEVAKYIDSWGEENKKLSNSAARAAILFWESTGRKGPRFNCWEFTGSESDEKAMRYYTTLVMTLTDASFIYHRSDGKSIKWYDFWDVRIGKAKGGHKTSGACDVREYSNGSVVCNDSSSSGKITFSEDRKSAATGVVGREFTIESKDGDMFLFMK
jgi:hypothetical protein